MGAYNEKRIAEVPEISFCLPGKLEEEYLKNKCYVIFHQPAFLVR
jgi:hypothetical protein